MDELALTPRKRTLPEHPAQILSLQGELSNDQKKVRVSVTLDRGDTRPDLDLYLLGSDGNELSHSTIVENFGPSVNFTMHIRPQKVRFPLRLVCRLSYLDDQITSEQALAIQEE